jgi:endogenous inhibitor of DNA gyrase (YacG/DUF329 family)
MRKEFICKLCNKSFVGYGKHRVYCSHDCKKSDLQAITTTQCPTCGIEFTYYKSWPRKYCSLHCAGQSYSKDRTSKIILACDQCGIAIERVSSRLSTYRNHFCSKECKATYFRAPAKPTKEKPVITRRRVIRTCDTCGTTMELKESDAAQGRRFCSRRCAGIAHSKQVSGANNHFWKGGGGKRKWDYGPNWQAQRRSARKRDNYACQRCGKTEKQLTQQLHVHHIKPFRYFGTAHYREANKLSNLACYCDSCHSIVEMGTPTIPVP